ncbi:MAG: enoyl-CoA hydratase-related protein [Xanthobacteraceae bacterium]
MTGTVLYEVSNGVARITLNRPPVNALNLEMIKGVVTALENAAKDEGARAVVLTSAVPKRSGKG